MDVLLFQKILDRRNQLHAELNEIDGFLRQAEAIASRLTRSPSDWPNSDGSSARPGEVKVTRDPPAFQTPDARRWPHADIGSIARDNTSR